MSEEQNGVIELTLDNFHGVTQSDDVVVIDISATWCTPCKAFAAVFEKAAERGEEEVRFATVDADTQPELGNAFNVESIPTVAVMRGGALIFMHEGSLSEKALLDVIEQARAIDPGKVRAAARTQAPA